MKITVSLTADEVHVIVAALREKAHTVRTKANDPLNRMQADLIDGGLVDDVAPGKAHTELDRQRLSAAEIEGIAERLYWHTLD